jgi:hypothetical protein
MISITNKCLNSSTINCLSITNLIPPIDTLGIRAKTFNIKATSSKCRGSNSISTGVSLDMEHKAGAQLVFLAKINLSRPRFISRATVHLKRDQVKTRTKETTANPID